MCSMRLATVYVTAVEVGGFAHVPRISGPPLGPEEEEK